MMSRLKDFKGRKFIGVAELASVAAGILENTDSQQDRGTVTEYPDERTVRYYLTEGLIPPPAERRGTASVFEYLHLLMLLTIKKMQADYLPIRKIREIINGKTEGELEKLLGVDESESRSRSGSKKEAQEYLETLLLQKPGAKETGDILFSRAQLAPQPPAAAAGASPPVAPAGRAINQKNAEKWRRFEIAKGLELHLEENFQKPSDSKELEIFIEIIRQIIQSA